MNANAKIFVTGHRGMVCSALVLKLRTLGFNKVLKRGCEEPDLLDQRAVVDFLSAEQPDNIFIAQTDALVIVTDWQKSQHPDFAQIRSLLHSPIIVEERKTSERQAQ